MRPGARRLAILGLLGSLACAPGSGPGAAWGRLLDPGAASLADLPLVEVPARAPGDTCAVLLSGDGGWARLDAEVAAALAARGCPVAGLSSLRYFWTPRTPEGAARDLERICRHYLAAWSARRVVLVGYSFGADVLPFLVNRLPPDLRGRISLVALAGLGDTACFEFHLSGWLGRGPRGPELPVQPELRRLRGPRILVLAGEPGGAGGDLPGVRRILLPGGHHFGGDYRRLGALILADQAAGCG